MLAIKTEALVKSYKDITAVDKLNLEVEQGELFSLLGVNGAGKTTLVRAILNALPYTGEILFGQKDGSFREKKPRFGYVPQKLDFDREMPLSVLEYLASGLVRKPVFFGISKVFREKVYHYLESVECSHVIDRPLGGLSGGELQRVLLAQALMQSPEILILDEPAAGVDFKGEQLLCELLESFRKELGFTQVMVTHDLSMVSAHAGHVICVNRTVISSGAPDEVLTPETLEQTFGPHAGKFSLPEHRKVCSCKH